MTAMRIQIAARNLVRHRVRTLIAISAIAFGIAALLIGGGFIEWIFWAMRESTIETGLGHVHVNRPGFRDAGLAEPSAYLMKPDPGVLDKVRALPEVQAVDQRLAVSGLVSKGDITIAFSGEAVDPGPNSQIVKALTTIGDQLSAEDPGGVQLGRGLAAALNVKRGDRVSFIARLPGGGINAVEGHVVGIFDTHVKAHDDNAVRIPIALGRQLLRVDGAHEWVLRLTSIEQTNATVARLKAMLPPRQFEVTSWLDLADFYRKAVVLLSNQVGVVGLLIGAIIVLGISNTLTMNVLERTGEIGTLMAMGTPRSAVLVQFVTEGLLLGLVGGIVGLVIGVILAGVLSFVGIPMPPAPGRDDPYFAAIMLTSSLAAKAFLIAVLSTMLASLYPAWRASRLQIVDALRHNR